MKRKGLGLITIVFIVLVVVIGGVSWYLNSTLSGQSVSQEIIEGFKLQKTDLELENSILFLEQGLWDSSANATQTVSELAGRNVTNESNENLLYWRCDLDEVHNSGNDVAYYVPTVDRVRLSLQNKSMGYLEARLNELHGVRDSVIYEVGGVKCAEVGYNEPMNLPTNTRMKTAGEIDYVGTTLGNYKREENNMSFTDELKFNRFWYMYDTVSRWTPNQNIQQDIESEMATVYDWVDDVFCVPTCKCPCPYQVGCTTVPVEWSSLVRQAVDRGIVKSVEELEYGSNYFDDNEVSCGHGIELDYYDATPYITEARIGTCSVDYCLMYCRLDYEYNFEGDIDIRCTDQRYNSIPRKDLEKLTWRIRLNVEATDPPNEGPWPSPCDSLLDPDCETTDAPDRIGAMEFPDCTIEESNFTLCETAVNVIGELTDEEKEAAKE